MGQFVVISQPNFQFESGPHDSRERAEKDISRVLSNLPQVTCGSSSLSRSAEPTEEEEA